MEDKDSYPNNPPMSKVFIYLWMLALVFIAIYIRVQGVSNYYYSEDESLIVNIAKAATLHDLLRFSLHEAHPPLFYVVLHYWLNISDTIGFVRSLSLLCGLALIPLYYKIGKLLNGRLTGLCSAVLITFSYGLIVQSYIARNYSMLSLFLSAAFYCYLLWRRNRKNSTMLAAYAFFSVLASLTHFSAIFAIFSIAAYETAILKFYKDSPEVQSRWTLANIGIAAVAITIYALWVYKGLVLGDYFASTSLFKLFLAILINPIRATEYVLPSAYFIPFLVFLWCLHNVRCNAHLRELIRLAYIPLALGMLLMAANRYYPAGTRHGIWILPFIIPICGWIMADGILEFGRLAIKNVTVLSMPAAISAVLFAGFVLYNPQERFGERSEYQLTENNHRALLHYLETFGPKALVIAERDDAVLLVDIYSTLYGRDIVVVPYLHTHILFNPRYRRMSTRAILVDTLQEAKQNKLLDGIDTLVFMKTDWDVYPEKRAPMPYLFTCAPLDKHITSFPAFSFADLPDGSGTTKKEKDISPVAFMSVSTKDFFKQVIASDGEAHGCLDEADNAK